jgi:hypothetical protein
MRIPVLDIAVVDTVATVALAAAIAWVTGLNFFLVFAALFVIGEIAHWAFCVDTKVMKTCNCDAVLS